MQRLTARVLAVLVGALGIAGLLVEDEHLLGAMNVDLPLDLLRIVLAVLLLAASFRQSAARTALVVVGLLYVGMGIVALADPELLGLLPTGFTPFDVGFHVVLGVAAIVVGAVPARSRALPTGRESV